MSTHWSESDLQARDKASFAHTCRRQGFCPDQFRLRVELIDHQTGEPASWERTVCVTHLHCSQFRRYHLDALCSWIVAFESDLREGNFHIWRGYDWA